MPQSLAKVYVHVIFSTKNRGPVLLDAWRGELFAVIGVSLNDLGCQSLIVGGVLFILIERRLAAQPLPPATDVTAITPRQALMIGLVQTLSLVPGVSRAATSIFGGMLMGLDRQTATRYSFYLAIPILGGATIVDLLLSLDDFTSSDFIYLAIGAIVSGIVAFIAIGWLLRYIAHNSFVPFGYYRIAAGIIILVVFANSNIIP